MTHTPSRIGQVIRNLRTLRAAHAAWDYEDLQDPTDKPYMLRFLPYLDGIESDVFGYEPTWFRKGRGHGRWEEFFSTLEDARTRMTELMQARAIEDAEIRRRAKGPGTSWPYLEDAWTDPTEPTED